MKKLNKTRFVVGLLVTLVIILAFVASRGGNRNFSPPTNLRDATPTGGYALGLVMQKMGYGVQSINEPTSQMPPDARLWFLLDSKTTFSDREADALLGWVKSGGTLFWAAAPDTWYGMFPTSTNRPGVSRLRGRFGVTNAGMPTLDPNGLATMKPLNFDAVENYRVGLPSASASGTTISLKPTTQQPTNSSTLQIAGSPGGTLMRISLGKGRIFLFPDAWTLCNFGLSQPANATLVANLLRVDNVAPGGKAYFDERQHDNTLSAPAPDDWPARLRQRPVVFGIWQLLVVGLGALALVSRRLGSPVALPSQPPVTRASGFARAMGGLLFKAARPKAAAQIIGESFRVRLARRIGLSPRESDDILASRASEISGIPRETLSRALIASRAPATNEASALRDAQDMERILEQLG